MSMYLELERGGQVELDLKTDHKLQFTDRLDQRKIVVQLLSKSGNKYARLAIDAPREVTIEVLPPDGVIFQKEGV